MTAPSNETCRSAVDAAVGETLVWLAGVSWDDIPGTDRRIVAELAVDHHIVWVDPPGGIGLLGSRPPAVERVAETVQRLRSPAPRGATRWPINVLAGAIQAATVRRNIRCVKAVVVANPMWRFPVGVPGVRVLYATDDWIAGASMMGLSPAAVRRALTANVRAADAIATVTRDLLDILVGLGARDSARTAVIPNGAPEFAVTRADREPVAALVGQINERLDLSCLEAVVDAGVPLKLIGPRVDREPRFGARLEQLLRRDGVEWTGRVDYAELAPRLSRIGVGITPYAESDFNACSFPLKTLEYLAAGVAVVSTDLPAARWLGCDDVTIAGRGKEFGDAVAARIASLADERDEDEARRRRFAAQHSWSRRADDLTALIADQRGAEQQGR